MFSNYYYQIKCTFLFFSHTWQCSELALNLGITLSRLRRPHRVPKIEPRSAICKSNAPPAITIALAP